MSDGDAINIPGDDHDLSQALLDVNLPNLLLVLASVTGSDEWLDAKFTPAAIEAPEGSLFPDDSGRYPDEIAEEIRQAAVRILGEVRDGTRTIAAPPGDFAAGSQVRRHLAIVLEALRS